MHIQYCKSTYDLAHLFVTRYTHYQRFLQLVKKGENVLKFKNFRNAHQ